MYHNYNALYIGEKNLNAFTVTKEKPKLKGVCIS